jgi:iron complex outermembrane recepter protein
MKTLLAGASLLPMLILAGATHAADANAAGASVAVGEVIVTGTRQTGVKAADSAAPIVMVGADALKRVAQPDLITALEQSLPSFNSEGYGQDTAALVLTADLRGLNPNDTLVLVNGKRRHTTSNLHIDAGPYQGAASADLGLIPIAAIDHIEVLEDGAAAQYGTDAIAGVINIILKKGTAGTLTGTLGQYYEGDGQTGAWSINKGFDLGGKGFINLTAEERYHGFSQRGSCDKRLFNTDCTLKASDNPIDAAGVVMQSRYPNVNPIYGDTKSNIYNGMYNAGYEIGDGIELYSFGSFSHRDASAFENYRVPTRVTRIDPATGNLVVPFPKGFNPREAIKENDYSVTGGLKGAFDSWNWDLSTTYGRDKNDVSTINSANKDLFIQTGFTPTNFYDGAFTSWQWTNNLDIDRSFDIGLAAPLNVGFGGEIRKESFGITAGDPASIFGGGSQAYPGFQPTDQGAHSRTSYAAYVDFATDPIANLKVDLAGRFEHYTDFGDAWSGKVTARYDFSPAFAIRGTVSTGFRAPTLAEEFYSATNVAPQFAQVNLPPNSPAAALAGFGPLKPEKSDNYSVGFVAHPMDRMQFTADVFEIDIRDRVVNTGQLLGSTCTIVTNGNCPAADYTVISQGVLNAIAAHGNVLDSGVSYIGIGVFTNGANTRTRGIESTLTYASDFGDMGHIDWSAAFSYIDTTITKLQPLPAIVANAAANQTTIIDPTSLSDLTTASPKWKAVLGANWTFGRFGVNLRETIYGPSSVVYSPNQTGGGPGATVVRIGTTGITDLSASFLLLHDLRLEAGADNLFDHRPPVVPTLANGQLADGNNVYNEPAQFSPWGIDGGYYYVRATYNF